MKKSETKEKNTLPTINTLYQEMLPDTLEIRQELKEIKDFVKSKLSHVKVCEKDILPTKDGKIYYL